MRAVGTITDSPLIKIKGVDVMYNFELKHKEYIDEISSTGYIYTHKCGAKLIYMENDDKNRVYSVAFNTLPTNDKGIPHIMEHSVLCGSENYRVKDPFNILDKGSIHTYLNAVTYSDKTIYPIASTNLTDFDTMVKVYTDGVFKPLIYEREGIFRQEGWNSDGKKLNGIVLNEMKGVFSAPDIVLRHKLKRELFKEAILTIYLNLITTNFWTSTENIITVQMPHSISMVIWILTNIWNFWTKNIFVILKKEIDWFLLIFSHKDTRML